jgi:hypothetical protein
VTVGSIPLVFAIVPDGGPNTGCVAMVSPFFGIGYYSDLIAGHEPSVAWPIATGFALFWIVVYSALALALGIAARSTFDRCLGRMPDQPTVPPYVRSSRKPKPKPAMAILDEV